MLKNLFNKKLLKLYSPIDGKTIPLENVNDNVFSKGMIGEGIAIKITGDTVVAPCDAKVAVIMETKHAVMLDVNGIELLIHIGIDTCKCGGNGFEQLIKEGEVVKKGTPIIKVDRKYFEENNVDLTTMVILTNLNDKKIIYRHNQNCNAGKDIILEF